MWRGGGEMFQKYWINLTHVAINMFRIAHIDKSQVGFKVHIEGRSEPLFFSCDSDDGRTIAAWLETEAFSVNTKDIPVVFS